MSLEQVRGRGVMYSSVTSRHFVYCRFTKKRFARLSMRSALSLRLKLSCSNLSASLKRVECLYYIRYSFSKSVLCLIW